MNKSYTKTQRSYEAGVTSHENNAPYALFLHWLVFFTVLTFLVWVLLHNDLIQNVIRTDPTRLSVIILLIFAGGTLHCALRSAYLSARMREIVAILRHPAKLQLPDDDSRKVLFDGTPLATSLLTDYLIDVARYRNTPGGEHRLNDMDAVLSEKITGSHETGWFFAQLLVKLGLLGTVIGFIIMLSSISDTISYDAAHVPELFSGMTDGMRVALNTTLVGLTGTILLGFQYLMIDRGADRLLGETTYFAATMLKHTRGNATG